MVNPNDGITKENLDISQKEFGKPCRRISIKNLPFGSNHADIKNTFVKDKYPLVTIHIDKGGQSCKAIMRCGEEALKYIEDYDGKPFTTKHPTQLLSVSLAATDFMCVVTNLPLDFTGEEFRKLVAQFGTVERSFLVCSEKTYKCMGTGYVEYTSKDSTIHARNKLNLMKLDHKGEEHIIQAYWLSNIPSEYCELYSKTLMIEDLEKHPDVGALHKQIEDTKPRLLKFSDVDDEEKPQFGILSYKTTESAESAWETLNETTGLKVSFCLPNHSVEILFKTMSIAKQSLGAPGAGDGLFATPTNAPAVGSNVVAAYVQNRYSPVPFNGSTYGLINGYAPVPLMPAVDITQAHLFPPPPLSPHMALQQPQQQMYVPQHTMHLPQHPMHHPVHLQPVPHQNGTYPQGHVYQAGQQIPYQAVQQVPYQAGQQQFNQQNFRDKYLLLQQQQKPTNSQVSVPVDARNGHGEWSQGQVDNGQVLNRSTDIWKEAYNNIYGNSSTLRPRLCRAASVSSEQKPEMFTDGLRSRSQVTSPTMFKNGLSGAASCSSMSDGDAYESYWPQPTSPLSTLPTDPENESGRELLSTVANHLESFKSEISSMAPTTSSIRATNSNTLLPLTSSMTSSSSIWSPKDLATKTDISVSGFKEVTEENRSQTANNNNSESVSSFFPRPYYSSNRNDIGPIGTYRLPQPTTPLQKYTSNSDPSSSSKNSYATVEIVQPALPSSSLRKITGPDGLVKRVSSVKVDGIDK